MEKTEATTMKQYVCFLLLIIIALFLLVPSCKNDDDGGDPPPPCDTCSNGLYPLYYDYPTWHPSGEWIAAEHSDSLDTNNDGKKDMPYNGIWLVDAVNGGKCPLISGYAYPSWSNDGSKLAMVKGGNIYTVSVSNSDTPKVDLNSLSQLTTSGHNFFPDWSPDGQKIVYDSNDDSPNGMSFIWTMFWDGSNKKRIAYEPTAGEIRTPDWAQGGLMIAHIRYIGVGAPEIYLMDTSGLDTIRLTKNGNIDSDPKFSPNDSLVVFYSQGNGPPSLCTIGNDGTDLKTIFPEYAWRSDWSPDGSKIVFVYWDFLEKRPGSGHLWIVNADGTDPAQLTH